MTKYKINTQTPSDSGIKNDLITLIPNWKDVTEMVVAEIHAITRMTNGGVIHVTWVKPLQEIKDIICSDVNGEDTTDDENTNTGITDDENTNTGITPIINIYDNYKSNMLSYISFTKDGYMTVENTLEPYEIMERIINNKQITIITDDKDKYDEYSDIIKAATQLTKLYEKMPIYSRIIGIRDDGQPEINTLTKYLYELDEDTRRPIISSLRYSNGYMYTLKSLADKILEKTKIEHGYDLLTQEQQVEAFISFSKLVANEKVESVPDSLIDQIKNSAEYQRVVSDLESHNFGLSHTQQFNVLQSVGYLSDRRHNFIYNLSDMGAGKTLMTVESIFLMDLKLANQLYNERMEDDTSIFDCQNVNHIYLPAKNLITPKLSVKSSWVDTFSLFYNIEEVSDSEYILSFDLQGVTYYTKLNVAAFTVKSNAIIIDNALPKPITSEILIIDEIHQLLKRPLTRSRFFAPTITPNNSYKGYILSGTLSNLTTTEWYNYIQFMDIPFGNSTLDGSSPKSIENQIAPLRNDIMSQISKSAEEISAEQKRYFDPTIFAEEQTKLSTTMKKEPNKQIYFKYRYGSKVIHLNDTQMDVQSALIDHQFTLHNDNTIIDTPNFELFYQLVGHCSITAQSTQIAEELFGEQKKQHKAEVINAPSTLTATDIELLRTLHDITKDYNIYKSQSIATEINNSILNLNDGLNSKNIYELLGSYAQRNTRFLEYLSTLNVDVLEKLPESGLIQQPKLEETPKFKILKDILNKEPNETYLIVVNDYNAMVKLSKALDIKSLTKRDTTNAMDYQYVLDNLFEEQSIVIVPQMMIKSSLDLVQANRLIQYQLNTEISDIIQTQNRINRIGQLRETKAYYIATDVLQKNIIDLFLETYKNIRVAHKGIVELFVDMSSQVTVVNDYIAKAMSAIKDPTDTEMYEMPYNSETGEYQLFDTSDITVELQEQSQRDIKDEEPCRNPNQGNLFSPLDAALEHQLTPAV